jgi:hypothetical protein
LPAYIYSPRKKNIAAGGEKVTVKTRTCLLASGLLFAASVKKEKTKMICVGPTQPWALRELSCP